MDSGSANLGILRLDEILDLLQQHRGFLYALAGISAAAGKNHLVQSQGLLLEVGDRHQLQIIRQPPEDRRVDRTIFVVRIHQIIVKIIIEGVDPLLRSPKLSSHELNLRIVRIIRTKVNSASLSYPHVVGFFPEFLF